MSEKEREVEEFERWNRQKQVLNFTKKSQFFIVRDIRWAYLGKNVSSEILGKGKMFSRPVLILKRLYSHSCLVIPLTSVDKSGSYYCSFIDSRGLKYCAVLSQIRYIDGSRIGGKLGCVSRSEFNILKKVVADFIVK